MVNSRELFFFTIQGGTTCIAISSNVTMKLSFEKRNFHKRLTTYHVMRPYVVENFVGKKMDIVMMDLMWLQ